MIRSTNLFVIDEIRVSYFYSVLFECQVHQFLSSFKVFVAESVHILCRVNGKLGLNLQTIFVINLARPSSKVTSQKGLHKQLPSEAINALACLLLSLLAKVNDLENKKSRDLLSTATAGRVWAMHVGKVYT